MTQKNADQASPTPFVRRFKESVTLIEYEGRPVVVARVVGMSRVLGDVVAVLVLGAGLGLAAWCWLCTGPDWNGSDPGAREVATLAAKEAR